MKTVEEVLEHHGVKGQRWGVRKVTSTSSPSASKTTSPRTSGLPSTKKASPAQLAARQKLAQNAADRRKIQVKEIRREQRSERNKKLLVAGAVLAGTFAVHSILKKQRYVKLSDLQDPSGPFRPALSQARVSELGFPASSIGKISSF